MGKTTLGENGYLLCKDNIPKGLIGFIKKNVLPDDNVLLYLKGNKSGFCYSCGSVVQAPPGHKFYNRMGTDCPACGARVFALPEWSESFDANCRGNVGIFQKGIDGRSICIRFFHILRRYHKTSFSMNDLQEFQRFVINDGAAGKYLNESKFRWSTIATPKWSERYHTGWRRDKNTCVVYDAPYYLCFPQDWKSFTKGTCLEYCDLPARAEWDKECIIRYALAYARFPAFEKLEKAGYKKITEAKLRGNGDVSIVGWSQSNVWKALRLPKNIIKQISPEEWDPRRLKRYINAFKNVKKGIITEAEALELIQSGYDYRCFEKALDYVSLHKIIKYVSAQDAKKQNRRAWDKDDGIYQDYINDCLTLNRDMKRRSVLFPKDLHKAHQKTLSMIRCNANREVDEKLKKTARKLEKYCFNKRGLIIRPARSYMELIKEGDNNNHCVGSRTYTEGMAEGKTAIFFIRHEKSPGRTYYTLEYKNGRVVQCRKKDNVSYQTDPEVEAFINDWLEFVKNNKRKRKAA